VDKKKGCCCFSHAHSLWLRSRDRRRGFP
jgi:hypothetical protein